MIYFTATLLFLFSTMAFASSSDPVEYSTDCSVSFVVKKADHPSCEDHIDELFERMQLFLTVANEWECTPTRRRLDMEDGVPAFVEEKDKSLRGTKPNQRKLCGSRCIKNCKEE